VPAHRIAARLGASVTATAAGIVAGCCTLLVANELIHIERTAGQLIVVDDSAATTPTNRAVNTRRPCRRAPSTIVVFIVVHVHFVQWLLPVLV
jgi:hypothetical protein